MNPVHISANVPKVPEVTLILRVVLDPVEPNVTKITTVPDNWLVKPMFASIRARLYRAVNTLSVSRKDTPPGAAVKADLSKIKQAENVLANAMERFAAKMPNVSLAPRAHLASV